MNLLTSLYTIIIYPLVQLISFFFDLLLRTFDNIGIVLIGLSSFISLLCLPLYIVAERWQQTERDVEKRLEPGVKRIKESFNGDEQYMILSTYYRQNNYHPIMALRSSFGLFIQIPFFMAAYIFLSNLESLKGLSLLFIKDMGKPDAAFNIGPFSVNVLPILMTIINCIAGAIYSKGFKAKDKIQIYAMACLFLVLLYNSPAGLVFYWTMNNVFSLIKNIFYKLRNPKKVITIIFYSFLTVMLLYILIKQPFSTKTCFLSCGILIVFYFVPLYIKFAKHIIKRQLAPLCNNNKERIALFITSAFCLCLLYGLYIPSLVVSSSVQEFADIESYGNPSYFVTYTFLQCIGSFIVWPLCIYFLFNSKIQSLLTYIFIVLLFCGIVNVFFFNGNYSSLNRLINFRNPTWPGINKLGMYGSIFVCVLIAFLLLLVLQYNKQKVLTIVSGLIGVTFLGVSLINSYKVNKNYTQYEAIAKNNTSNSSIAPLYHLSKNKKNVVVFMLDRAENGYVQPIFDDNPELYQIYKGFKLYRNTVSCNGNTLMGVTGFFGGYEYTPLEMNKRTDEKRIDETNEALLLMPRIFTEQAGFTATMTDPSWANYSWIPDITIFKKYPKIAAYNVEHNYTQYWMSEHPEVCSISVASSIKRNLLWYSLFRCSLPIIRKQIYNEGRWWEPTRDHHDMQSFIDYYAGLYYMDELTDFSNTDRGVFVCINNNTSHEDVRLQAPEYVPVKEVTQHSASPYGEASGYDCNVATYKMIGKWITYLKQNGCYDNTRIIMASDHGHGTYDSEKLGFPANMGLPFNPAHFNPLLMVKDFNDVDDFSIDEKTFMCNADVPSLALDEIVEHPVNPFTNKLVTTKAKQNGVVVNNCNLWSPGAHLNPYRFTVSNDEWYTVHENIFKPENWHKGIEK